MALCQSIFYYYCCYILIAAAADIITIRYMCSVHVHRYQTIEMTQITAAEQQNTIPCHFGALSPPFIRGSLIRGSKCESIISLVSVHSFRYSYFISFLLFPLFFQFLLSLFLFFLLTRSLNNKSVNKNWSDVID